MAHEQTQKITAHIPVNLNDILFPLKHILCKFIVFLNNT